MRAIAPCPQVHPPEQPDFKVEPSLSLCCWGFCSCGFSVAGKAYQNDISKCRSRYGAVRLAGDAEVAKQQLESLFGAPPPKVICPLLVAPSSIPSCDPGLPLAPQVLKTVVTDLGKVGVTAEKLKFTFSGAHFERNWWVETKLREGRKGTKIKMPWVSSAHQFAGGAGRLLHLYASSETTPLCLPSCACLCVSLSLSLRVMT